jgi:hypothetical protein
METTEQTLLAGLEEALSDLEFIRDVSEDQYIRSLAIAAVNVARIYLNVAKGDK